MLGIEFFISDIEALINKFKIKFATSVIYRKCKDQPTMELMLQGNHAAKLKAFLCYELSLDIASVAIEEKIKTTKKKKK